MSTTVVLYSDAVSLDSHRVRLVLAEKGVAAECVWVDPNSPPTELLEATAQNSVPALIDRDLVLYNSRVIIDYLDERYPHPPLMPIDPVSRARTRLALYRIESDWLSLAGQPEALSDALTKAADVFSAMPFFLSDEPSILDATLAPLLWQLVACGIVLPNAAKPVHDYANRLFSRPEFEASLSPGQRDGVRPE